LIAVNASRDVSVDVIQTSGFDLAFYRNLVRNGYESPDALQPIRRLASPPLIYLKTIDEDGAPMDARTVELAAATIVNTASSWTGGRFGVAGLERGSETRVGVQGWLTVRWQPQPDPAACGRATIGLDGGLIDFYYRTPESAKNEVASPMPASWNQIAGWLKQIDNLRQAACDLPLSLRSRTVAVWK
jgi:hypothetical protein